MASIQSAMLRFLLRKTVNWNKSLDEVRAFQANVAKKPIVPKGMQMEKVTVGEISAEIFIPAGANTSSMLVYVHGGGYCLGIVHANRNFVMKLSQQLRVPVILPDYRLAPENPYPAALTDMETLYQWIEAERNLPMEKVGVLADSSGCGLALATHLKRKESDLSLPRFQVFMSPVVDLKRTGKSFKENRQLDPYQLKEDAFIDNHYLQDQDAENPYISPYYGDLSGMPSTLIQVATYDVFQSDAEGLAAELKEAGVDTDISVWQKMWHNFQMSEALLPEGKAAIREISAYITSKFR